MKFIYVDPSATVPGNGSLEKPYRTMDEVISSGVSHPVTVSIKRGTHFYWSYISQNVMAFFLNRSGTQSVLTSYGEGAYPIWYPKDAATRHTDTLFQNFNINSLQLSSPPGEQHTGGYLYGTLRGDANGICNLEIHHINFIGDPAAIAGSAPAKEVACIHLTVKDKTNIAHKVFIHDIYGDNINCGIFIRGNPHLSEPDTYYGDQRKSYGVRILDVSFTNIVNYGVLLSGAASKNKNRDVRGDEWESGWDNIYYSSYRTNVYNPIKDPHAWTTARADVPLWMTMCAYATGQNFEVHGSGPAAPDRYALDLDYHCNHCLLRWGYLTNNAKPFMFVQGPFSNSWYHANGYKPLNDDIYTLYHTLGLGCVNNVIEYIVSYNDGVARTQRSEDIYWKKACCFWYCYNNVVRNCLFIDTVSQANDHVLFCNPRKEDNPAALAMTLENCIFYWKHRDNSNLISPAEVSEFGTLLTKYAFKNCIFYSEAWSSAAPAALAGVSTSELRYVDPKFRFTLPLVPPAGMKEAKNILQLASDSPALKTGTTNTGLDIWGNAGNNIGWQQHPTAL
ncbi:hypothetical protein L579_4419 [Pantoea sp. AS-PWVM4]|uniref:hypothetical protein n=1 Tax=Pantoea sp. AS-PWVM4 TaxID=1332069 RepID=UPI0003AC85F5|nr:hypothetical protein [Pantoea sp. AS-PWVM4]ERK16143.1 hypothetical protein L579_4419 [Pantoea sp. AS-PWVM4]